MMFLGAVLVLTLGLIGVFAFEAYRADRSHRRVTEQVLHDYVRFAALELARHSSRELDNRATRMLDTLACNRPELTAERALRDLTRLACGECNRGAPLAYVRFDPWERGAVVESAGALSAAAIARIEAALADAPRNRIGGIMPIEIDGRPHLLAWRNFGRAVPVPVHAILFAGETLTAIVDEIVKSRQLLPKALADPDKQRAYVGAEVDFGPGVTVQPITYSAAEPIESAGDVRVVATLSPAAAESLIIGGVPRSRLPQLAALLVIATGLIAVAGYQLHREHELTRLRAAFVSGVSHELRTPLAQIRLFAETLRLGRSRSAQETQKSLEILDEEAERLSHLVDNLLTFNRSGHAPATLRVAPVPLGPFVADTVERFEPLVREHDNRFTVEIPDGLGVQGDPEALARVFINLLENAVKYGEPGQTVRISAVGRDGRTYLIVDDEGPGVQFRDRLRIWEPFARGAQQHASTTPDGQQRAPTTGTGIGLSVVRDLTAAMGGSAWADEAPSGGARFVVELPAANGAPDREVPGATA